MPDVRLFQSDDGGEVECINGQIVTADGLETSAYLSLFGGNERDSGLVDGEALQWWANFEERITERRQRSRLQHLLQQIPALPFNLQRAEDAALQDLAWMTTALNATVAVVASIPDVDRIQVSPTITIGPSIYKFDFESKWGTTE